MRDGKVYRVPIDAAREKARPVFAGKLAKAVRVNVDSIEDITGTKLETDGYR